MLSDWSIRAGGAWGSGVYEAIIAGQQQWWRWWRHNAKWRRAQTKSCLGSPTSSKDLLRNTNYASPNLARHFRILLNFETWLS